MTLKSVFQLQGEAIHNPANPGEDWDIVFGFSPPPTTAVAKVFVAEPPGVDSTYFEGGGSKDPNDLNLWRWGSGPAPDKDEITDAYAAAYFDTNGNLLLYFGADRFANNGDATIGFWFFQNQITLNPDGTFNGLHAPGDLLIVSDFTVGGAVSTIKVYQWTGNPADPLALLVSGADCGTMPPAGNLCAIVNTVATPSPWPYTPKSGPPNIFPPGSFFEGGINIGQLFGVGCFHSFLAETRSSQAIDAALRDFSLGSFNVCSARISIEPSATNEVGSVHTFTVTVEKNPGTGFVPASGVVVQGTIVQPGSVGVFVGGDTCTTDINGQCTLSVTSDMPGQTTVSVTATVTIGSHSFTVSTDGTGQNSGPAVKTWVDGFISLTPLTDINSVGEPHTVTATVFVNAGLGAGYVPAPDGTLISFSLLNNTAGAAFTGPSTCFTSGGTGSCSVQINATTPGSVQIHAQTTVTVSGVSLTRATGTGGLNSADASKTYAAASITLTKEVEFGPLTTSANVCFTLSRTDGPLIISPSTPATQCLLFTSGTSIQSFFWDGLASGEYQIVESIDPPYTPIAPIVLTLDVLTQPSVTFSQENPLTEGQLLIEKRDDKCELWVTPPVTFFICQGDVPVCDSSSAIVSVEVGNGNNPVPLLLPEGYYTVCEVPPPGYVVYSPPDTAICPPCRQVQLVAGQTTTVTFFNLPLVCVVTIHCGGIRFE